MAKGMKWDNLPKPSSSQLAYIAGFFDGEGCVVIVKAKSSPKKGGGVFYTVYCTMYNTNLTVLKFISSFFPATIVLRKTRGNRKPCFVWQLYGTRAGIFLRIVFPFLIVKKEVAEIALHYLSIRGNPAGRRNGFGQNLHLSLKEIEFAEESKERIHVLNRRGKRLIDEAQRIIQGGDGDSKKENKKEIQVTETGILTWKT